MRKAILTAHLYLGLASGQLFSATGLTGSLLVFSEELDHWANPSLLTATPAAVRADLDSLEAAVSAAFPDEKIYRIRMPQSEDAVIEFWLGQGGDLRVYADPYTGRILGSRYFSETWRGWLFGFHTELFSGEKGKTILGIGGFVLLAIGVTGIFLWWRGRRNLTRGLSVNVRNGWRRANFDLHNAVGFIAFFFLSISAISGIYLVFNAAFEKTVNRVAGINDRPPPPLSQAGNGRRTISLGEAASGADAVWPEAVTTWIYPPAGPQAAYMVRKRFDEENHPNGKSFIFLDQYSGDVLRAEDATEAPRATKLVNDLYPLHIGTLGGTMTRLLQVAVGLTPAFLMTTGVLMWLNRRRKRK